MNRAKHGATEFYIKFDELLPELHESLRITKTVQHLHTVSAALHKVNLQFDIDQKSSNPIIPELVGLTFFLDYEKSENKEGKLPVLRNTPFMIP